MKKPADPTREALQQAEARRRILAQWRGFDASPLEKARQISSRTSRSILPGVLQRIGLDRKREEAQIFQAWKHAVDAQTATHARPVGIRNGTLFVAVDSHVWLDEIVRYRRKEILERLQVSFGRQLIQRISFRVGV